MSTHLRPREHALMASALLQQETTDAMASSLIAAATAHALTALALAATETEPAAGLNVWLNPNTQHDDPLGTAVRR